MGFTIRKGKSECLLINLGLAKATIYMLRLIRLRKRLSIGAILNRFRIEI